jgi:hypothetical protein
MGSQETKQAHSHWVARGLWIVLGLLAAGLVAIVIVENRTWNVFNPVGISIGLAVAALSVAGFVFGWGPTLPCMFFRMLIVSIMTDLMRTLQRRESTST